MPVILAKNSVMSAIMENKRPLHENEELVLDQKVLVKETSDTFGFTVHEEKLESMSVEPHVAHSETFEGAVLIVRGMYTVDPVYEFRNDEGNRVKVKMLVSQQTQMNAKNRLLAKKLIDEDIVELYEGCDEEYLYEVLSEASENAFFTLTKKLADGLPIYGVEFKDDGTFALLDIGTVKESY